MGIWMQDWQMRLTHLIDHAEREHGAREIVTRWTDGTETRTSWRGIAHDARRCAQALLRLGVKPGERVATLAMNHQHHLSSWYGIIGMGGIIHTVNPRLFPEQIVYVINHAEDTVLLYDSMMAPLVDKLKPALPSVKHYICFDRPDGYQSLLDAENGDFAWVDGDERDPCMLCYTSGTTGNPKGVMYEHRSTMLHALCAIATDNFDLSARAIVLPVVPMFHAAGWGLPFSAPASGAKLVFSLSYEPAVLHALMLREGVTHCGGVPTVWLGMMQYLDASQQDLGPLRVASVGGAAAPRILIEWMLRQGIDIRHAWGMTETSPTGTLGAPLPGWETLEFKDQVDALMRQGHASFGIDMRVVDDSGTPLPRDGVSSGHLQVRGPWVVKRYYRAEQDAVAADQWFDTGDVAILHPDGTMRLTDRAKDMIKSGGEWISSVDLENAAMSCPGVAEAAAIAVPHPKWDERPLLVVLRKPGATITAEDIRRHLEGHIASWWMPDAIEFVDSLPHTATGKVLKSALREQYRDYDLARDS